VGKLISVWRSIFQIFRTISTGDKWHAPFIYALYPGKFCICLKIGLYKLGQLLLIGFLHI
jgi:hypothetical protein